MSVRSLIVLVLLCGAGMGWVIGVINRTETQRRIFAAVWAMNGYAAYDYQWSGEQEIRFGRPKGPAWLRKYIGDKTFQEIAYVALKSKQIKDSTLIDWIEPLDRLDGLSLYDTAVTDDGLRHLEGLTQLRHLRLHKTLVTDSGLRRLEGMPRS